MSVGFWWWGGISKEGHRRGTGGQSGMELRGVVCVADEKHAPSYKENTDFAGRAVW